MEVNEKLIEEIDAVVEKHTSTLYKDVSKNIADGFTMIRELGEGWTKDQRRQDEEIDNLDTRLKLVEVFVLKRVAIWAGGLLFLGALAFYLLDKFNV